MFSLFTMITIEYRIDHNQQTAAYLPAQLVQAHSHHEGHWLHCQAQADHVRVLYWKKRCIMFSSFVPFCMAGQVECTAWLLCQPFSCRSCDHPFAKLDNIMDNNKTVVEDNAMDLFMAGPFLQWVSQKVGLMIPQILQKIIEFFILLST